MREPNRIILPLLLFLLIPSAFFVTASTRLYGYEGTLWGEAKVWIQGGVAPQCPGGVLEITQYLPSLWLRIWSQEEELFRTVGNANHAFLQPGLSALLCLVFYGFARSLYRSRSVAVGLTMTLAFTTMIWPYSKFGMEVNQSIWTLAAVWFLWMTAQGNGLRGSIPFALALGLLALTKVTGVVHCAALILAMLWLIWSRKLHRERGFAWRVAIALVIGVFALQLLFLSNQIRFGGQLYTGRYNMGTELSTKYFLTNLLGVLFGVGKSIFVFNPVLIISVFFLPRFLRRFREMQPIMWVLLALAIWYLALSNHFHDETWGPRRFHFLVPILLLPLGCLFEKWRDLRFPRRVGVWFILWFGFAVQLTGICFDYSSHGRVMGVGNSPIYTIENNVWNPRMSAPVFNIHLALSAWSETFSGQTLDYVIEPNYVPWHRPDETTEPILFDVYRHTDYDFWWVQHWWYGIDEPVAWHGDILPLWAVLMFATAWSSLMALIVVWRRPVAREQ